MDILFVTTAVRFITDLPAYLANTFRNKCSFQCILWKLFLAMAFLARVNASHSYHNNEFLIPCIMINCWKLE